MELLKISWWLTGHPITKIATTAVNSRGVTRNASPSILPGVYPLYNLRQYLTFVRCYTVKIDKNDGFKFINASRMFVGRATPDVTIWERWEANVVAALTSLLMTIDDIAVGSDKLEGYTVWTDTIQYSPESGPLSVHKLFTSCIRRCLVSRACDWVMLALTAALLVFSFQFSLLFSIYRSPGSTSKAAYNWL